jgi:3-hydroxyisobutyrate dehydrogenase-like beta-hydroxyacid dehydrogenase
VSTPLQHVAFIGFGEVGRTFTRDLQTAGVADIRAFDIAFAEPESRQLRAARTAKVRIATSPRDAAAGADLIISAVTAGAALDAARSIAAALDRFTLVIDVNSVSPATKVAAAEIVDRAGGRYVEAAVMAPVAPKGLRTSLLLGGRHAGELIARAAAWRLDARAYAERIGAASSVKMCRSIMIKGLEALAVECVLASRHYGVLDDVLGSLGDTYPGVDWSQKARYLMSRALIHGRRRAEEMREVAKTVAGAGYDPVMTDAIAVKQDWAADLGAALGPARSDAPDLATLLAAIEALDQPARAAGDE